MIHKQREVCPIHVNVPVPLLVGGSTRPGSIKCEQFAGGQSEGKVTWRHCSYVRLGGMRHLLHPVLPQH